MSEQKNLSRLIPVRNLGERKAGAQFVQGIYTRSFTGRFRNWRIAVAGTLLLLFFGTSWINWKGRQAVLWNLDERQFYVFGTTFWPQDFMLLSLFMIIGTFILFAVTVFAGRVWCGYACPQSVWTWVFMWVEKVTEGDRNQRIKLAAAPWSRQKISRRLVKHSLWLLISLASGIAFVGYFIPVRELVVNLWHWQWFSTSAIWVFIIAGFTYTNAGWLREQVCLHMCPYARFQSVMFDRDTLVVSYDPARGERRGSRKKDDDPKALGLGDCIDCYMCVQVCPTGIDIRDGLQMDCIGCAACIDACDSVMDKMGYARGLVSYTSERALAEKPANASMAATVWRPKLMAYLAATIIMAGFMAITLQQRELIDISVVKDRNLYRKNTEGDIVNVYRLKITNKTQEPGYYQIGIGDNASLSLVRHYEIHLKPGEVYDMPVAVVKRGGSKNQGVSHFRFTVNNHNDPRMITQEGATFLYPAF